ncbi:E3 ubiquitin-protein ligase RNF6 isoform X1 [Chiloscyllium plagiosum]|uniref:E3 ubiquitin-protein ligase RNF6 isoform X1 n=2 Tax=Chiloscyllium plagiosum TaxID=36176 RepID=UPI001CB84AAF|nr:E3 ubiquitin-protein ligase RNF6 isoform X1 [Chiloscyllium plagiosum]XP_043547920.1 E3 ubiquitin-protein ligase RNF6 isoform X1 [Chiloscyllium plagiosum]XP_043547921.1 E3 ubiquitin-protein ligase RNF6 isoform X1 [Chiloscyllium plagiosum]
MEDTSNTDVEVSLQLVGIPSTMDPPNHANRRGDQQSPTENLNHSEDERSRQLERLSREEAYYQFINDLSEEDYRLMRDSNLLGTPGEITAEELQQRLNGAKEQLTTQNALGTYEHEQSQNQGSDTPGESSNSDSLLEWLNTFRRTGNATRSGQSGNQTWRAVSRTNPNSGEFRFSLEININHEHDAGNGQTLDTPTLENRDRNVEGAQLLSLLTPVASRTRSRTRAHVQVTNFESNFGGTVRVEELETMQVSPPSTQRSFRSASIERSTGRLRPRRPSTNRRAVLSAAVDQQIGRRRAGRHRVRRIQEEEQERRSDPAELQRHSVPTTVRESRARRHPEQRRSSRNFQNQRSRSPIHRTSVPVSSSDRSSSQQDDYLQPRQSTRRQRTMDQSTMTTEELQAVSSNPSLQSTAGGMLRQQVVDDGDVNHPSGSSVAVRRHPTIMLDLQVRRIRPGESRDRDSIANRTRSRVRMAENTVTFESDSGGFRRTISRSELAGIRTYVSTIRIPLRRISETGLGEPSSIALRSILRQIMTGFGELSSLMENDSDSELNQRVQQNQSERSDSVSSQISPNSNLLNLNNESTDILTGDRSESEQMNESMQNETLDNAVESQETRQSRDTNSLVENGTLPILRLAHFFLLNDDEEDERQRGLTKEQIDNLLTRNYGNVSAENEVSKTCSVCINDYAVGNKLRRLPCAHEFHIHCIDRWLSENSTCPICRQPILGSSN